MRRLFFLILLALFAARAYAQSTNNGTALCTAVREQSRPTIVSDGAGGAIVAWQDLRSSVAYDIYAQHVLASGAVDPAWPADGRALCTALDNQNNPTVVSDGSGGAIVTWEDNRSGTDLDIYAQHVLASGAADPAWPANGRALCTAAYYQFTPVIVADGSGGAIVAWSDARGGTTSDIYAQHVLASGTVDPAWPADGRALCTAANSQTHPTIVADGTAGAIVTWQDLRGGTYSDIYAQHVLASGAVDSAWPADGRALCSAANEQVTPNIVVDGAGGAIVTWNDTRSGNADIYAQHVLASGAVDPSWPTDGRALCTQPNYQYDPAIASDGGGGAIVVWWDGRHSFNNDIYSQHVLASGAVDPAWPVQGSPVCTAVGHQDYPTIVADAAGGAIVAWMDFRGNGDPDLYAQHVLASGAMDPAWSPNGRVLSAAPFGQSFQEIVADGAGGAIATWQDDRSGSESDIYAQRVSADGEVLFRDTDEPSIVAIRDVPSDQGGRVFLTWQGSGSDRLPSRTITGYRVWRRVPALAARQSTQARDAASPVVDPMQCTRIVLSDRGLASATYWEAVATLPAERLPGYGFTGSTPQDSVTGSNPYTAFFVSALTVDPFTFYQSNIDSGYSVDNLAPPQPLPFAAVYGAANVVLHWTSSRASDFREFRLYRGTAPGFVPGAGNMVLATRDTGYRDVPPQTAIAYYKLAAIDVHGNVSQFTLVSPASPVATLASLVSADARADRIRLMWYEGGNAGGSASVYRRSTTEDWALLGNIDADGAGYLLYEDLAVTAGVRYGYRLGIMDAGAEVFAGEVWVVAENSTFALEGVRPNPAQSGQLMVQFVLPSAAPAKLELFDIAGRRVAQRDVGSLGAGRHAENLAEDVRLLPGVYLVRFTQAGNVRATRAAVLR
jgi:hypothetical protein